MTKRSILKAATAVAATAVVVLCVWIMSRGAGLNPDLDFGAGAYYYADIPEFYETFGVNEAFRPALPYLVYVALFLAWGYLMWLLWKWVDKK